MFGLSAEVLMLVGVALIAGGIVKGVTGLALPIVSLAITINFLAPKTTIALLVFPILITNCWQAFRTGLSFSLFRRFRLLIVLFIIFLVFSATIVVDLKTDILFLCLGAAVTIFAVSNLVKPQRKSLSQYSEKIIGPIAGVCGGLLGGVSTMWGPPITMFLVLLNLDKDEWVRVVALIWFVGSIPLTITYLSNGILNIETIPLSIYACIPGMIGIFIGENLRKRVEQEKFRKILLCLLFAIGLDLIRRAFI